MSDASGSSVSTRRAPLRVAIKRGALALGLCAALASLRLRAADAPPATLPFTMDFERVAPGTPPEGLTITTGEFVVVKIDGNTVLEVPGDPLEIKGALFGPENANAYTVTARVQASSVGKLMPEFGVGACGPGKYRLWVMPAVGELQLIKDDEVQKAVPYAWTSGQWTRFKLQVRKSADGKFVVEGKAWPDGKAEPKDWAVTFDDTEAPPEGRAGVFATTYPGTPVRFDDLAVTAAKK
jgi:hypothetical protein